MNNPVQIASYESIRNDIDFLIENKSYDLVIIDEAQRIKNDSSQISKVIKKIPRKYSWALTGTPVKTMLKILHQFFNL